MDIEVREEQKSDFDEIEKVVKEAFCRENMPEAGMTEWDLVRAIRKDKNFTPALSLVAQAGDEIVGHVMFSQATIGAEKGLALAPLSVKPAFQKKGVGKRLVKAGIKAAAKQGFLWIVLLGGSYYEQFGFIKAAPMGIRLPYSGPENDHLYILPLASGATDGLGGTVRFADCFYKENGELI